MQLEVAEKEQWSDQNFPLSYCSQGTEEGKKDQTENWESVNADAGREARGEKKEAGNVENSITGSQFSSAEDIFRNEIYLLELCVR